MISRLATPIIVLPDGATLEGEGVLDIAPGGRPAETGFVSGRTRIRATGSLLGDVVTLGDGSVIRGLQIEDVTRPAPHGNTVLVSSRSVVRGREAVDPANPMAKVKGRGKRRHGKAQLRIDESRRWLRVVLKLADEGEEGAVAAVMTLLMNMRCSEIVSRIARDVDDEGKVLWISASKTSAGRRTLEVPAVLVPHLRELAADKQPGALLFGRHWRDWPRHWVKHICEKAGVPKVCAHAMRGAHASLATERGITAHVVAAALGHESETTTFRSYATAESVEAGRQRRLIEALDLVDNDSSPIVVQSMSGEKGGAAGTSQVPETTS